MNRLRSQQGPSVRMNPEVRRDVGGRAVLFVQSKVAAADLG